MSHADKQISAFKSNLASSSQKNSQKRTVPPVTSTPSPAPSQGSTAAAGKQDLKRKRPDPTLVYSQPANTGTGRELMTQSTFAVQYLKEKGTPQTYESLLSYLSLHNHDESYKLLFKLVLRENPKIIYNPKDFGDKGSFSFKPKHDIRNGQDLLRQLQAQRTAKGFPVKELLEGWATAEEDIRTLENENKLLVIRNKKDDHARSVWQNDPTLAQEMDLEFKDIWHKVKLPDPETIVTELEKNQLLPANKSKVEKVKAKAPEKKTKKPRRSGKTTNTHMKDILRDFSHLKK